MPINKIKYERLSEYVCARLVCTYKITGHGVRRLQVPVFSRVSSAQITKKTHPPAARRATAVVACCRRACITRTEQHSTVSPQRLTLCMYQDARVDCCVLVFLLSSFIVLSRSSSRSPPSRNYTRTAHQNATSPASTQHRTGQSGLHTQLLALSIR